LRVARGLRRGEADRASMRAPSAGPRAAGRRPPHRRAGEPAVIRALLRTRVRFRVENTAADRIAVCSLEKVLSRRP
jgi:hypothetical protein